MKKMSKKIIALFFVICMSCINCFAAIISDNDGAAFVTKAEFEALKNDFSNQIEQYNTSIDSKIDGAISAYLAGINLAKKTHMPLMNDIKKVRCMYEYNDTTAKDLAYVYCAPKISGKGTDWQCGVNGSTQYGVYAHDFVWNAKSSYSITGERNMIDDLNLQSESDLSSSAKWLGHYKKVIDELTLTYSGSLQYGNYGAHMSGTNTQNQGLIAPRYSLIYNKPVTSEEWLLGTLVYTFERQGYWSDVYSSTKKNLKVGGYVLNTTNAEIYDKNLIIWQPETYYAFTPVDQKFFGFDKVDTCGSESKTTGPKLHEAWSVDNTLSFWNASVASSTCGTGFSQSNITHYAQYSNNTIADGMYNKNSLISMGYTPYNQSKSRWIWPYPSFPYKHIKNWVQLYLEDNDWAIDLCGSLPTDSALRHDSSGKSHFSLVAGWPLYQIKFEKKYEFEIGFEETDVDHLLFLNYGPFNSSNPTSSINAIKPSDVKHDGKTTTTYPTAIVVEKGKKVKIEFESNKNDVLFLKWCDDKASGSLNGGGTIILPDEMIEIG